MSNDNHLSLIESAIDSLLDDLQAALGREPTACEEADFLDDDRISCRMEYFAEQAQSNRGPERGE